MSGIYIHIPFCKQACHYCDFHFSTSLSKKEQMLNALKQELALKKDRYKNPIETIYFGGGTPSLLTTTEIIELIEAVANVTTIAHDAEITLEANPDDLTLEKLEALSKTPVNRLSIGVQSFFEEDLKLMNRAHDAKESEACLEHATKLFNNITIDLIYGIPNMSNERWSANINKALSYNINHISSYALTVEPKTALEKFIQKGIIDAPLDSVAKNHFDELVTILEANNFVHYELSNFGKENYFSKHNTSYWLGKEYVGIGPSAHSYHNTYRSWNVANNSKYIKAISQEIIPEEKEVLSEADVFNEYIMTGLRTIFGVNINYVERQFGKERVTWLLNQAKRFVENQLLEIVTINDSEIIKTTKKGKFLCDGIASDLFIITN